jgi:uncharacterized repeat protein (TIGR03803 family)
MSKFNRGMRACGIFLLWAATPVVLPAQTFTTLHSFTAHPPRYGFSPDAGLIQGTDGKLYGTTELGGHGYEAGTVFNITTSGILSTLHSFNEPQGVVPVAALVQATNGKFYGTTIYGGANVYYGTVFSITASGKLKTLHGFDGTDGSEPSAALVQAHDGALYGTTREGGANYTCSLGCGTIFKITPSGTLTPLHSFNGTDGGYPTAGLVQGTDGNFYGTTYQNGTNNYGTVFRITPNGQLTTLHIFDGTDGANPYAGLIQGTDGNFYGTASRGGPNTKSICSLGCGTIFQITPSGTLTTLYNLCSQVASSCTEGYDPNAALVQDTNGTFYGTTYFGGANGYGTAFSLSVGLGPFVKTQPTSGKVGARVKILGTKLTGATRVTFNGTPATFTVKSKSEITTTVPTSATTGKVQVVTPGGTLSSNVPFTVR